MDEEALIALFFLVLGLLLAFAVWRFVLTWRIGRLQSQLLERFETLERELKLIRMFLLARPEARPAPATAEPEPDRAAAPAGTQAQAPADSVPAEPVWPAPAAVPPPIPSVTSMAATAAAAATGPDLAPDGALAAAPTAVPPPVPPSAPAPPPPASRLETVAGDLLRRCWNWIAVGSEYRQAGVTVEYAVATTWLIRLGIFIVVLTAGFFLRYSVQHGWINPTGRVTMGTLVGVAMLAGGVRLLGRRYHLFGQGLIGGGLAVLYLSFFAAFAFYHLMPMLVAFALMALVTLCAGVLAVRLDSILVAVLGLIGGYLTPVMLSTGEANFVGLFSYLLLLGVGVLGVAHCRQWLLLNWLGFVGTYVLFYTSLERYYQRGDVWRVLPFLAAFFLLYTAVVFVYNVAQRKKSSLVELAGLVVNAAVFFHASRWLIVSAYRREWFAAATLGAAACYIVMVLLCLNWRIADRPLLLALTALAAFFVTITMPVLLSREWLTVSWAIQAFLMLWVGSRIQSRFIRTAACLLYALVLARILFFDLGHLFRPAALPVTAFTDYWPELLNRLVAFGVPALSLAAAAWLLRAPARAGARGLTMLPGLDIGEWVRESTLVRTFLALAVLTAFVYAQFEFNRLFAVAYPPLRLPALTLLWAALCGLLAAEYARRPAWPVLLALAAVGGAMVVKLGIIDMAHWELRLDAARYGAVATYSWLEASLRLLDYAAVVVLLALSARVLFGTGRPAPAGWVFGTAAVALLFVYVTLEANTALGTLLPRFRAGGVSIAWAVFALALVLAGLRWNRLAARLTGLVLFAVVGAKVLLSDLRRLEALYRIVAFLVLGLVILAGSLLYLRNRQKFTRSRSE